VLISFYPEVCFIPYRIAKGRQEVRKKRHRISFRMGRNQSDYFTR
jgi:hypothetical protein